MERTRTIQTGGGITTKRAKTIGEMMKIGPNIIRIDTISTKIANKGRVGMTATIGMITRVMKEDGKRMGTIQGEGGLMDIEEATEGTGLDTTTTIAVVPLKTMIETLAKGTPKTK